MDGSRFSFRQQLLMSLSPLCAFLIVIAVVAAQSMLSMNEQTGRTLADMRTISNETRALLGASGQTNQLLLSLLLTDEQRAYDPGQSRYLSSSPISFER